jgi:hypothetical protein
MDEFVRYLETFISREREIEKQKAENYIELIHMIKSELMTLQELNQPHWSGGSGLTLVAKEEKA